MDDPVVGEHMLVELPDRNGIGIGLGVEMRPCRRVLSTTITPPGRVRGTISSQYAA